MARTKAKARKKPAAKKTERKPPEPPKQRTCEVCGKPIPYGERCIAHELVHMVTSYAEEREAQGNALAGMLWRIGGQFMGTAVEQELHKKAMMAAAMHHARRQAQRAQQQAAQPPPPPPRVDPFAVLGLDRINATVEIVRARQRELARIFHTDLGGGPAAQERLAEFNAAADEAVRILRGAA